MRKISLKTDGALRDAELDDQGRIHLGGAALAPEEIRWEPVTDQSVICAALNDAEHYAQLAAGFHAAPYGAPPEQPVFFVKPPNTLTAHLTDVQCPEQADGIHTGAGLAVAINRPTSRVNQQEAWACVSGYTIFNDFTLAEDSYFRPPVKTKCVDSFGPVGPYIVARDEIPDPHGLAVTTRVNGEVKQTASTAGLRLSIPALIEALSEFMTLATGSVVVSGFPAGRVKVKPGDEVVVEIEQIGSLTNHIVAEAEYRARRNGRQVAGLC